MKAKKSLLFATAVAGFLSCLVTQSAIGTSLPAEMYIVISEKVTGYGTLLSGIVTAMMSKGVKADDLDFTLPGEPGHKSSKLNSVFEQQDTFLPSIIPPQAFDGQMHYVFTGSDKISGVGTDTPEILFITWPIKKEICTWINKVLGLNPELNASTDPPTHILSTPPDLTPFHHETGKPVTEITVPRVATDPAVACVQDKSGVRYYIHTLVER